MKAWYKDIAADAVRTAEVVKEVEREIERLSGIKTRAVADSGAVYVRAFNAEESGIGKPCFALVNAKGERVVAPYIAAIEPDGTLLVEGHINVRAAEAAGLKIRKADARLSCGDRIRVYGLGGKVVAVDA